MSNDVYMEVVLASISVKAPEVGDKNGFRVTQVLTATFRPTGQGIWKSRGEGRACEELPGGTVELEMPAENFTMPLDLNATYTLRLSYHTK